MEKLLGKKGLSGSAQMALFEKTVERLTKAGGAFAGLSKQYNASGNYRAMAYGAGVDKLTWATTHGRFGELHRGDMAISPNLLKKYPMGSHVDVIDSKTGAVLRSNVRVADTSWITSGRPTYNSFELWGDKDLGRANLRAHQNAMGGIVGSKMLSWLGERGAEAVIPMTRSARSLGLLAKTAGALGVGLGRGGHSFSISSNPVINVTTGEFDTGSITSALDSHIDHLVREIRRSYRSRTNAKR
jgi:hypothetical protein